MSRWVTLECERVLYIHEGIDVITCDRLPAGPVTLVVKLASADTHAERCDVEQAQPARVGSAVPSETSADAQEQPLEPKD